VAVHVPQDMQDALDKFDSDADDILQPLMSRLKEQGTPTLIYHYTNDFGLRGNLETGRIWLSDVFKLNDPSELRHGVSHAAKVLNAKAADGPAEAQLFAKLFTVFFERGMEGTAYYFVCSLSSESDDLGQWRAYADDGRGYALGFDGKMLEDAIINESGLSPPHSSTYHVEYNDIKLADIQRQIVEAVFPLISLPRGRNLERAALNSYMNKLSVNLSLHVLRASLFFKHEAYKNEKEFRFLQIYEAGTPPPSVKRRYRAYELVKYREFDWRRFAPAALREIVVGPSADPVNGERFARDCLAEFHTPGDVSVKLSRIPYRGRN